MTNHPNRNVEKIIAPDGRVWRLKRSAARPDGSPATGPCAWHACTGGAGHSNQWKYGESREAVLSRVMTESV
jgi:hypothetical protein